MVELVDGNNVKFFNRNNLEWNTENLRTQSVINNYSLNVNDRMELYRKMRTEGLEKNSILYKLYYLIMGNETDQKAKNKAVISRRKRSVKKQINEDVVKSATSADYQGATPLVMNMQDEKEEFDERNNNNTMTESHLQKLLADAELDSLGLNPYPMYHFDR